MFYTTELSYWYFRSIGPYVFGLKEYYLFVFVCSCNGNTLLLCSALKTKVGRVIHRGVNNAKMANISIHNPLFQIYDCVFY